MVIYFDHAATSFPKPPCMLESIRTFTETMGANPGRSAHAMALSASRFIFETRQLLAQFFNVSDAAQVIFTSNITEALNLAILGVIQPGDHVVTTSMEHNAVMRPLRFLEREGQIRLTVVSCNNQGLLDPAAFLAAIQPNTKLVVLNHASNVCGTIQPLDEIAQKLPAHVLFLLDTAQTAGVVPIDMQKHRIDLLAFTGHKSLLGPTGIGGLCIRPGIIVRPLKRGGTGSASDLEYQPEFLPDALESGTLNTIGIAGLAGSLSYLQKETMRKMFEYEQKLLRYARGQLHNIPHLFLYPSQEILQTATLSIQIHGLSSSMLSFRLDREYQILTRAGLHCSPTAHRTLGTFPHGTVRISMGYFNRQEEIDHLAYALNQISKEVPIFV